MNIYTADIILILLLISVSNNFFLNIFQMWGWNFLVSEVVIGIILLAVTFLVHKFIFRRIWKK